MHLTQLGLSTGPQRWAIPSGDTPTINYAADAITLENLRLQSGAQQIEAAGRFGQPGDALHVTLGQHRPRRCRRAAPSRAAVHRHAQRCCHGRRHERRAAGERSFRGEPWRLSAVPVRHLRRNRVVRGQPGSRSTPVSQQNPTQWITARGYLPASLVGSAKTEARSGRSRPHRAGHARGSGRPDRREQSARSWSRPGVHHSGDRCAGHRRGAPPRDRERAGPAARPARCRLRTAG